MQSQIHNYGGGRTLTRRLREEEVEGTGGRDVRKEEGAPPYIGRGEVKPPLGEPPLGVHPSRRLGGRIPSLR